LNLALLPGDGVGPEVIGQAVRALEIIADTCDHDVDMREFPIGGAALRARGVALPPETLDGCLAADAVLLGAVGDPAFDHLEPGKRPESALLALRGALGGFANLRPALTDPALINATPYRPERVAGADVLIVRELLGGLYFGQPRGGTADEAFNTMRYTRIEVERVARVGFEQARRRRQFVCSVDKANVLETSRLWRAVVSEVAKDYPDVELEHVYVDTAAMRLATSPTSFDVMLCDNLFGDILSDQAASIAGSLGLLPSATLGGRVDLYEPVHGSAPDIAGKGLANPIGAIASAAMLLRFSAKMDKEAAEIDHAIEDALAAGARTKDIAGPGERVLSTREMGQAIEEALIDVRDRKHSYHGV